MATSFFMTTSNCDDDEEYSGCQELLQHLTITVTSPEGKIERYTTPLALEDKPCSTQESLFFDLVPTSTNFTNPVPLFLFSPFHMFSNATGDLAEMSRGVKRKVDVLGASKRSEVTFVPEALTNYPFQGIESASKLCKHNDLVNLFNFGVEVKDQLDFERELKFDAITHTEGPSTIFVN